MIFRLIQWIESIVSNLPLRLAYLVNTYPRPSLSFVRREIRALERLGHSVTRIAMRGDRTQLVDEGDLAEHDRTHRVLDGGAGGLMRAVIWAALRRPSQLLRTLRSAIAMSGHGGPGFVRHLIYLAEACAVLKLCKTLDIQHLHAHFGTNSTTVARLVRHLGGLPYSFTVHGPEEFDHPAAIRLADKVADAVFVVAISQYGRSQLMRLVPHDVWDRIKVVHCGIEPALFSDPAPVPERGAGVPLRLVTIGRLVEQKGQLIFPAALADIVAQGGDVHLTIVGDGELRAPLEQSLAENGVAGRVTITGWLDEAGVRQALADAHVMVLPSFAEGLPMVLMEAMVAARPVIATYVAGIPELVQHDTNGLLVPAGDAGALAHAVLDMTRMDHSQLSQMGAAGRTRALERHDIDTEARKLNDLFAIGQS